MKTTFEWQDALYAAFRADAALGALLGLEAGADDALARGKLRREDPPPETVTADAVEFVAFYFAEAKPTENYLVNEGALRLDIYARSREAAGALRTRCAQLARQLLRTPVAAEGQVKSEITGVYKYRLEYRPLVAA